MSPAVACGVGALVGFAAGLIVGRVLWRQKIWLTKSATIDNHSLIKIMGEK